MWGGVSLAAALILCCAVRESNAKLYGTALFATVCLMAWTSDQGGKLTHGEGFLTEFMPAKLRAVFGVPRRKKSTHLRPTKKVYHQLAPRRPQGFRSLFSLRALRLSSTTNAFSARTAKEERKLRLDTFENVMRGGKMA